jgi:hypothetical protein
MSSTPRTNSRPRFIIALAFILFLVSHPTGAQQRGRGSSSSSSNSKRAKPAAKTQAQEIERARRSRALALLFETAEAARGLDDFLYRARLQALAADAIWPFDPQRARAVFRHAWEAATLSDKAEQEAIEQQDAGALTDTVESINTQARDEVLSKTAARDAALAEIFLRELMKDKKSDTGSEQGESAPLTTWREPSADAARRLELAFELLDQGEVESAYKIAAPVAQEGASTGLITFLLRLQGQNAGAADNLYRLLIGALRKDALADANTVLLLSTPIVSPDLMVAVDEHGALQFRPVARRPDSQAAALPPFSPVTRNAFLNVAASILLRPFPSGARSEIQDKAARYFAIGRLLPYFEREAPQFAPELQARATSLLNDFTATSRTALSSQLSLRSLGATPSTDPLRAHFEELARTKDQSERDRITLRIAIIAAHTRAWDRARRAASELSDERLRRAATSYIAVNQIADISRAYADEKEDDYESIVGFLKGVDVPPLAAAWGYAQAAEVAARKKDPQHVNELLTEAEHYAERVDAETGQRVAAYAVILKYAARLDQQRAWELLAQLVKAANALENYAGDEVSLDIRTDESEVFEAETPFTLTTEVFRLDATFATMARLDFERALQDARALEGPVPRVFAQLAIARAGLEKK